jgi:hypothetical protein
LSAIEDSERILGPFGQVHLRSLRSFSGAIDEIEKCEGSLRPFSGPIEKTEPSSRTIERSKALQGNSGVCRINPFVCAIDKSDSDRFCVQLMRSEATFGCN